MTKPGWQNRRDVFGGDRAGLVCAVTIVIIGLMTVAACGAGNDGGNVAAAKDAKRHHQPIAVTRKEGTFRPTCGPRRVGRRVRGFSRALATVDADALRRYWGRNFMWFRILRRRGAWFETESYEDGLASLRRKGGLRLLFREVELNDGRGNIEFDATFWTRRSDRKDLGGKAKLSCRRPTIVALTSFHSRRNIADCPKPRRSVPPNAIIVCSGRNA